MAIRQVAFKLMLLGLCLLKTQLPARCQVLVGSRDDTSLVFAMVPIGDEIWFGAEKGVFRIDRKGGQTGPLGGNTGRVTRIVPIGDEVWLSATNGVFRVTPKDNHVQRLVNDTGGAHEIVPIRDEIWLAAENGAFRVNGSGDHVELLGGATGRVFEIKPVGDEIWLAAQNGAFRVSQNGKIAELVGGDTSRVFGIAPVGDEIWLAAENGAFRVDRGTLQATLVGGVGPVREIVPVGVEVWLKGDYGTFRIDAKNNQAVRLSGYSDPVRSIVPIGDEVWLATDKGAFRIDQQGRHAIAITGDTGKVSNIVSAGSEIWIVANGGLFSVDRSRNQAVSFGGYKGWISSVVRDGDEIWFAAERRIFWVDRRTRMRVDLKGAVPWISRLLGKEVWLDGTTRPLVRYIDMQSAVEKYSSSRAMPISLTYDSDRTKLDEKEKDRTGWKYLQEDGPLIDLKPGWTKLYFTVRDNWGNELQAQSVEGWVIPAWTLSALIPILGIGLSLLCLGLAPYVRYCHMLLMNPFLRNWASFGIIPLLITAVPFLRRHILRRHCRAFERAPRFRSAGDRYVVPEERFSPSSFATMLSEHKVIGFHGQSGIGKSVFLEYFAYECASRKSKDFLLRRLVPVFIDLSIAGALDPDTLVRTELRKYGDLTDKDLTAVLLDQGGFLFLFDGLNEVNEASALAIVQFADMHRNHGYACLAAQVATEELMRVSTLVPSSPLSDDKIRELVVKLAMNQKTQSKRFDPHSLLSEFSDETYKIGRVPLQLEMLLEMWEASGTLPRNLDELYSHVLGPLLDKEVWSNQGHGDWPDILSALAFTMMAAKRPYDPQKDYLPDELRAQLVSKKLLVERGAVLEFRHDRVRAFLAARYFGLRWRTILSDEKGIVDPNWDTMLEFHLSTVQDEGGAKELLFFVVKKDMGVAIRINSWGLQNRREVFKNWQNDFSQEIGKRVLGHSGTTIFVGQ